MLNMDAIAGSNRRDRLQHLKSLTLETAARELEDILEMGPEFWRIAEESGVPMSPNQLPGPSLAILLRGDPTRK